MALRVAPIVGIFTVAGMSLVLVGCDDIDDAMRVFEGKPTKAQVAAEGGVSYHLATAPEPVKTAEDYLLAEAGPMGEAVYVGWPQCSPRFREIICR